MLGWPARLARFNVWVNLPTFDPTAGGDVVARLERDARFNIALGFLLPFLIPAVVKAAPRPSSPSRWTSPQTLIWTMYGLGLPAGEPVHARHRHGPDRRNDPRGKAPASDNVSASRRLMVCCLEAPCPDGVTLARRHRRATARWRIAGGRHRRNPGKQRAGTSCRRGCAACRRGSASRAASRASSQNGTARRISHHGKPRDLGFRAGKAPMPARELAGAEHMAGKRHILERASVSRLSARATAARAMSGR